MPLELALRLTELALAVLVLQRGLEHLPREPWIFAGQMACALALLAGQGAALPLLWALGVLQLWRFDGPYNGGADKMAFLVLSCATLAWALPDWAELALGYLAVQLVLSYAVSGWVKLVNPDWRSGRALAEVFAFSIYPSSQDLRRLARRPALMRAGSWGVIGFELAVPLALVSGPATWAALAVAALFHGANAMLFGLNRFVWAWLAAFPALIWAQARFFGA